MDLEGSSQMVDLTQSLTDEQHPIDGLGGAWLPQDQKLQVI